MVPDVPGLKYLKARRKHVWGTKAENSVEDATDGGILAPRSVRTANPWSGNSKSCVSHSTCT